MLKNPENLNNRTKRSPPCPPLSCMSSFHVFVKPAIAMTTHVAEETCNYSVPQRINHKHCTFVFIKCDIKAWFILLFLSICVALHQILSGYLGVSDSDRKWADHVTSLYLSTKCSTHNSPLGELYLTLCKLGKSHEANSPITVWHFWRDDVRLQCSAQDRQWRKSPAEVLHVCWLRNCQWHRKQHLILLYFCSL